MGTMAQGKEGAIMKGKWQEVVRLAFKGRRFEDHALDLTALGELSQYQKMVAETAKVIWRNSHPDRRLPKGFQDQIRLCLRKIEDGSVETPLEVFVEEPEQKGLFELEPPVINKAIDLTRQVLQAVAMDRPLPRNFPKSLVPEYERFGQGLAEDETIELIISNKEPVRITRLSRSRLAAFVESSHEGHVDITGEVLEADIRRGHFQIWLDEKKCVTVMFSPEQEDEVTKALRDHQTLRLQVKGQGEFSAEGKLVRITQVEELRLQPLGEVPYDATARPIEEVLEELAAEIPREAWDSLPLDLTDNLDHYLYGTPKQ